MKAIVLSLFCLMIPAAAGAAATLECGFDNAGMRAWDVRLFLLDDGSLGSSAEVVVSGSGRMHKESVTAESTAAGELYHLWLSRETPQHALEMIVYPERDGRMPARMINPNMPFFREVRGNCARGNSSI